MQTGGQWSNRLQTRLLILLVVFSLISAVVVGGINLYLSVTTAKTRIYENDAMLAKQIASEMNRFLNDAKGLTETLAASPTAASLDAAKIRELILAAQQKNPQFELLYVMDKSGMQIARTSGTLANRSDRPYFKEAILGKVFFTDTYISSFTNAPTVTISCPIKDSSGANVGVLAADISLKALWDMVEKTNVGVSGYVDVVDNKGTLLAHPDKEKVIKTENVAALPYIQTVIAGQSGVSQATATTGVDSYITFAPIGEYKWGVITYLPAAELNQTVLKAVLTMLLLLVLILCLAVGGALVMAKSLARPIQNLAANASAMAAGDLSRTIAVEGVAEVVYLGEALEQMRKNLQQMIRQIMQSAEQLAASAEEMNASSDQSAQAVNQVAISISEVASGAEQQLCAVDAATQVVADMSGKIQQVAAAAGSAADHSLQTAETAREGETSLQNAVGQMTKITDVVNHSAQVVMNLGNKSKEIGQIIDTISGLASQTNLLALNAAIEAARAGEQGRGFAVVASEVGKLAEQSQEAAQQIAALIYEVQGETNKAVLAMQTGNEEVKAGSVVVDAAGSAFTKITALVDQVSEQIRDISNVIAHIAAGSEKIVLSVKAIDEQSQKATEKTQTVSAATEEQSASMEQIAAASQSLAQTAQDLQKSVSQFKI